MPSTNVPNESPMRWPVKLGLIALSTLLLSLSLAPIGQFYLAWIGLIPWLIVVSHARSMRSNFVWSWLGGMLFFTANMWWLWKVTIPGMLTLLAYLALYFGFAALIFRGCGLLDRHQSGLRSLFSILMMSIVWIALEWLRGNWSMFGNQGLPWLHIGVTQSPLVVMCQVADFGGIYAVTFWVIALNALGYFAIVSRKRIATPAIGVGAMVLCTLGYGVFRMKQTQTQPGPVVVVIQSNYPQSNSGEKGAEPEELLRFHLDTTRAALAESTEPKSRADLVVWSETMMPPLNQEFLQLSSYLRQTADALSKLASKHRVALVTGGSYGSHFDKEYRPRERRNSVYLFASGGVLSDVRYDKVHLVPFGEFIPFASIKPLYNLLLKFGPAGYEDYILTPGSLHGLRPFELMRDDGTKFRFVTPICFEDLMGALVAEMVLDRDGRKRADFIVNVTNDGWFMANEMPQHLQAAIFRSIENRVPTARSVNTGISGFIDSLGRAHDLVPANTEGFSAARLAIDPRITFYSRQPDLLIELCAAIATLFVIVRIVQSKFLKKGTVHDATAN